MLPTDLQPLARKSMPKPQANQALQLMHRYRVLNAPTSTDASFPCEGSSPPIETATILMFGCGETRPPIRSGNARFGEV
jgi:hypothetical protein